MKLKKVRVGIVGCGAIGSRIAKSIKLDLNKYCQLSAIYDIDESKAFDLAQALSYKNIVKSSFYELIESCDCMIEAVNAKDTRPIIRSALEAGKTVLAMSVGKLLNSLELFQIANKNKCKLLVPSGAIAGIDAIKAASLANIKSIKLTTRKPPSGFRNNSYFIQKGIDLAKVNKETILFKGSVDRAVKIFPQNINVAATISLASQVKKIIVIQIITSPKIKKNSHEIEVVGDFGRMITRTENIVCPDNPKTSYLAVLSGIQTLKQFCTGILIGT